MPLPSVWNNLPHLCNDGLSHEQFSQRRLCERLFKSGLYKWTYLLTFFNNTVIKVYVELNDRNETDFQMSSVFIPLTSIQPASTVGNRHCYRCRGQAD